MIGTTESLCKKKVTRADPRNAIWPSLSSKRKKQQSHREACDCVWFLFWKLNKVLYQCWPSLPSPPVLLLQLEHTRRFCVSSPCSEGDNYKFGSLRCSHTQASWLRLKMWGKKTNTQSTGSRRKLASNIPTKRPKVPVTPACKMKGKVRK